MEDSVVKSKMTKKKKVLLSFIPVAVVLLIIAVVFCVIGYMSNGPFTDIMNATLNTAEAESFTFSLDLNGDYAEGRVVVDFDKKEIQAVIDFENDDSFVIYGDYLIVSENETDSFGEKVQKNVKYDISDKIESCFDGWDKTKDSAGRGDIDWDSVFDIMNVLLGVDKAFAEKHVNFDKADDAVAEMFFLLNDEEWLTDVAGFEEQISDDITTYKFDFDLSKVADSAEDVFADCLESFQAKDFMSEFKTELYSYDEIGAYARASVSVEKDYIKEVYVKVGKGSFFIDYKLEVSDVGSTNINGNELQDYLDNCSQ